MYLQQLISNTDTCPSCSHSWKSAKEDLETAPVGSYALDQTLIIIMNCDVCQLKFKRELDTIKRIYDARQLNKQGFTFERV